MEDAKFLYGMVWERSQAVPHGESMAFGRELAGPRSSAVPGRVGSSSDSVLGSCFHCSCSIPWICHRESKLQTISPGTGGAVFHSLCFQYVTL